MFELLKSQPSDKIMELMVLYSEDSRADKLDLGVGVYKDANGITPIMKAIKESERSLLENQISKSYVGLLGSLEFCKEINYLVLNDEIEDLNDDLDNLEEQIEEKEEDRNDLEE